ncbi:hypothetical protein [Massilia sp. CCM 8734]|uniref:hypothetical protein n=1 Tax=Massilia sp. CCM 8734 TaxID=2609283 RepID=UPI001423677B|nr:hypothetical protein [Massilia sp. CCM 8734]NHZ96892.1 hypothetical protein [Massilia sp. CCM 8734]
MDPHPTPFERCSCCCSAPKADPDRSRFDPLGIVMEGLTVILIIVFIGIMLLGNMCLDQQKKLAEELAEARSQLADERVAHQQLRQQLQQRQQQLPATLPPAQR